MKSFTPPVIGEVFERLTIVCLAEKSKDRGLTQVACECSCGNYVTRPYSRIARGKTKSCGCLRKIGKQKHGDSPGKGNVPEYIAWCGMRYRCENPTNKQYCHYGGRGITVCERWHDYPLFLADVGRKPSPKHSLDRINNDGNYEPSNCRWATQREQSNNRRRHAVSAKRLQELLGKEQLLDRYEKRFGVIDF